jgi:hypothetical protein
MSNAIKVTTRVGANLIHSKGVRNAETMQKVIHLKGKINEKIWDHRQNKHPNPMYPIGSVKDFDLTEFDLVASVKGEELPIGTGNNYVIQTALSSCANGLTGLEQIQFRGIMRTQASLANDMKGPQAVFQASGSCSMVACEDDVVVGDMLVLCWPTYVVIGGIRTPLYNEKEKGRPTRFPWVARVLKAGHVFNQFVCAAKAVCEYPDDDVPVSKRKDIWREYTLNGHLDLIEMKDSNANTDDNRYGTCPMWRFIKLVATWKSAPNQDEKDKMAQDLYDNGSSQVMTQYELGLNGMGQRKMLKRVPGDVSGSSPVNNHVSSKGKTNAKWSDFFYQVLGPMALLEEQLELLRPRIIGKAISGAMKGRQFEVMIGSQFQ